MLSLTVNQPVVNITRIKVMGFKLESNMLRVWVEFRPNAGGQDEATQSARSYGGPQLLRIRNAPAVSDVITFNTDPAANPYTGLLLRGAAAITGNLNNCIAAISGQTTVDAMLTALESALSTDGNIPAGTVS